MNSILDIGSFNVWPTFSVTLAVLLATRFDGIRNSIIASVHSVPFMTTDSEPNVTRRLHESPTTPRFLPPNPPSSRQ